MLNYEKRLVELQATAYHNVAVEFEHLSKAEETVKFYLKAFTVANKYLGKDHTMTILAQKSWFSAKVNIAKHSMEEKEKHLLRI